VLFGLFHVFELLLLAPIIGKHVYCNILACKCVIVAYVYYGKHSKGSHINSYNGITDRRNGYSRCSEIYKHGKQGISDYAKHFLLRFFG